MSDKEDDGKSKLSKAPRGDPADAFGEPQTQQVSVKEIAAKYSTKIELYKFLAARNNVYLPHHRHITIWFLKDVMSGKKLRKYPHDLKP